MKRMIVSCAASYLVVFAAGCSENAFEPSGTEDPLVSDTGTIPVDLKSQSEHLPTPAATTRTMLYFGGPVISNPKVYVVWWGSAASINSILTAARGGIADFYAGVTNSNYLDWWNEYDTNITVQSGSHAGTAGTGQHIGRGNLVGTRTLTPVPAGNVTDTQIQATLDQAFTNGTLPQPDANTIYAIHFPRSVTITLDGSKSCSAFGGYHFNTVETTRHNAYYIVIPDCGNSFRSFTIVNSHELAEATTDAQPTPGSNPDFPQAWNNATGSEVGDLCQGTSGSVTTALGTFTVQGIWDEPSHGCPVFRSNTSDYNVSFATPSATLAAGGQITATVRTATVRGTAQTLTLSVTAPAGVTATISPTQVTSGASATLTVSASSAVTAAQVIVSAVGTTGSAAQTHTASLLLNGG
ncbi:MAG TPA: hypothetical protein VF516_31900 [Kofleriaceae bacterium]